VTDTVVDPNGDRLPIRAVVPESVSIAGGRNRSPGRAGPGSRFGAAWQDDQRENRHGMDGRSKQPFVDVQQSIPTARR